MGFSWSKSFMSLAEKQRASLVKHSAGTRMVIPPPYTYSIVGLTAVTIH